MLNLFYIAFFYFILQHPNPKMNNIDFYNETITSIDYKNTLNITTLEGKYHIFNIENKRTTFHINTPLLATISHNTNHIASSEKGDLIFMDINTKEFDYIKTPCGSIENIHIYCSKIVCGGYNKHISLFNNENSIKTDYKVYHTALKDHTLLCGGEQMIWAYDLRNYEKILYIENMNNNIRSVALIDNYNFIIGSCDGKIKIDAIMNKQEEKLLFIGHKIEKNGKKYYYPVEKLLCEDGRIYSCGDERIIEWDLYNKKKKSVIYNGSGKITNMVFADNSIYFVECSKDNNTDYRVKSVDI